MAGDLAPRPTVQVRRSSRRRRTVAAYRDGDTVVVLIPARFSLAEEREWVQKMLARLDSRERRSRRRRGDADLESRARQLGRLFEDTVRPVSVRWVGNQRGRWGSCTPADGTIRLSDRLRGMPDWVVDYVLVHELAHLRVPGHGADFWALVERYPRAQRARGYLEGVAAAAGVAFSDDGSLGGLTGDGPPPDADASEETGPRHGQSVAGEPLTPHNSMASPDPMAAHDAVAARDAAGARDTTAARQAGARDAAGARQPGARQPGARQAGARQAGAGATSSRRGARKSSGGNAVEDAGQVG